MTNSLIKICSIALTCGLALSGCADGTNLLTTASLPTPKVAAAPAVNPVCTTLTAKINRLRSEGTMARLAKVAEGKSRSAMVKRISLGKAADLDQANAQFQAQCTSFKPTAAAINVPTPVAASRNKIAAKAVKDTTKLATKAATSAVTSSAKKTGASVVKSTVTSVPNKL